VALAEALRRFVLDHQMAKSEGKVSYDNLHLKDIAFRIIGTLSERGYWSGTTQDRIDAECIVYQQLASPVAPAAPAGATPPFAELRERLAQAPAPPVPNELDTVVYAKPVTPDSLIAKFENEAEICNFSDGFDHAGVLLDSVVEGLCSLKTTYMSANANKPTPKEIAKRIADRVLEGEGYWTDEIEEAIKEERTAAAPAPATAGATGWPTDVPVLMKFFEKHGTVDVIKLFFAVIIGLVEDLFQKSSPISRLSDKGAAPAVGGIEVGGHVAPAPAPARAEARFPVRELRRVLKDAVEWNDEYKRINNLSGDPHWVRWAKATLEATIRDEHHESRSGASEAGPQPPQGLPKQWRDGSPERPEYPYDAYYCGVYDARHECAEQLEAALRGTREGQEVTNESE
jgi:hypothetical protein